LNLFLGLVFALVEVVMALVGPTLEFLVPLAFYLVELTISLVLLFIAAIKGLFKWQKPNFPDKFTFVIARQNLKNKASQWRSYKAKRDEQKKHK